MPLYKRLKLFFEQFNLSVFLSVNFLLIGIVLLSSVLGEDATQFVETLKSGFLSYFSWAYFLSLIFFFVFTVYIYFKYGHLKIGGETETPEFSNVAWISMLFSAGMGTGLIYSGAYEPLYHYFHAPQLKGFSEKSKILGSLDITYYHWGILAWVIYGVVGLAFSLLHFNSKKAFKFSDLVGSKFQSQTVAYAVDVFSILAILLGVVTTFSLAASQISSGLFKVLGWQVSGGFIMFAITFLQASLCFQVCIRG